MACYDIMLLLNGADEPLSVSWSNERLNSLFAPLVDSWVERGIPISECLPLPEGEREGTFSWDDDTFSFAFLPAPEGGRYLLLSRTDDKSELLARALDQLFEGVQIYDKDARAVFFNRSSRRISRIPDGLEIEGRHLLDLYSLSEDVSTTMTALRTGAPVIDRVDRFSVPDGTDIVTANTSYPIYRDGELMGAITYEQTEEILREWIGRLESTGRALKNYSARTPAVSFSGYTFDHVIGHDQKLREAVQLARRVAAQDASVMLVGETGTGKEIFAQSIHRASRRHGKKFLAVNCAAVPEPLIESILFGTQNGSFTGSENQAGYFEEAEGGTIFLDELNSMSLSMQSKILRVIQEKVFRRLGSTKDIEADVRIISSCNEDPFRAVTENRFRRDLFYRLSTVTIELPPLREHMEDLMELIEYHLAATSHQFIHNITSVSPDVMELFRGYSWPGNVRELFHVIDYAQNVADGNVLQTEHLPSYLVKSRPAPDSALEQIDFSGCTLQSLLDDYEHAVLLKALDRCGNNISLTAKTLGILRQSLQYRIRKYGIIF